MLSENEQMMIEIGNVIGKREMLYFFQKAAIAKGGALTLEDINQYNQVCLVNEQIYQTADYEDGVQQDVRISSIKIACQTK